MELNHVFLDPLVYISVILFQINYLTRGIFMKIFVYFNNEEITTIPYHSLVSFRLFCEQQGLHTNWSSVEKKLDLFSDLKQMQIALYLTADTPLNRDVVQTLEQFLSIDGSVTAIENAESLTTNPYLQIKVTTFEHPSDKHPFLLIEHSSATDERLRNLLRTELNHEKIPFQLKEIKHFPLNFSRGLILKYHLPPNPELEVYKDLFSISIARAILRYFNRQQKNFISYLPKNMLKNWLVNITQTPISSAEPYKEPQVEGKEHNSQSLKLISKNPPEIKRKIINAEVFFDYTILIPQSESELKDYLIEGNLYIKNTGNRALMNPVICIKITPVQSASLQGQIIPPKMVSSLGTKSMSGDKGWKYVYDDWRERVKTKGEYWISPIQVLQIPPGETIMFNFKINFEQPKEGKSITAQGFVYFQEEKKQFPSNNQISFSF